MSVSWLRKKKQAKKVGMSSEPRTKEVLTQEYMSIASALGGKTYQIHVLNQEIEELKYKMSQVNLEASELKEEEPNETK